MQKRQCGVVGGSVSFVVEHLSDNKYSLDVSRLFGHSETLYPYFNTMILNMYFHNYDRVVVLPTVKQQPLFFSDKTISSSPRNPKVHEATTRDCHHAFLNA